jgi:hypothetical protein
MLERRAARAAGAPAPAAGAARRRDGHSSRTPLQPGQAYEGTGVLTRLCRPSAGCATSRQRGARVLVRPRASGTNHSFRRVGRRSLGFFVQDPRRVACRSLPPPAPRPRPPRAQPFIDATHPIQDFFPERKYAILLPTAAFVTIIAVAGTFVGCVMIQSGRKKAKAA